MIAADSLLELTGEGRMNFRSVVAWGALAALEIGLLWVVVAQIS